MLSDSVFEQDHINVVVKILFLLTRWFLPFQLARTKMRLYRSDALLESSITRCLDSQKCFAKTVFRESWTY